MKSSFSLAPGLCHNRRGDPPALRLRPLAGPRRRLPRRPDGRARRDDRQRRPAVDPRRPRLFRGRPGLGRQRLHAHLRRLPPARRPARRPLRAAAPVHDRHRPVQPGLARLRPVERAAAAGHRPGGAGHRRRDRRGGGAGAADEPLHRAGRARQGDGRLRLRLRQRRQHRRAPRRRPHRRLRLALDLPRQPADRPGGAGPQPGGAAGDEGRRGRGRGSTSAAP